MDFGPSPLGEEVRDTNDHRGCLGRIPDDQGMMTSAELGFVELDDLPAISIPRREASKLPEVQE